MKTINVPVNLIINRDMDAIVAIMNSESLFGKKYFWQEKEVVCLNKFPDSKGLVAVAWESDGRFDDEEESGVFEEWVPFSELREEESSTNSSDETEEENTQDEENDYVDFLDSIGQLISYLSDEK